jgi:hypothetical protein
MFIPSATFFTVSATYKVFREMYLSLSKPQHSKQKSIISIHKPSNQHSTVLSNLIIQQIPQTCHQTHTKKKSSTTEPTCKIEYSVTADSKTFLEVPCPVFDRSFLAHGPRDHHHLAQAVTLEEAVRVMDGVQREGG